MDDWQRTAWRALDVLDPEAVAHYLSRGDPLLKAEVLRQIKTDYANALRRLHDEAAEHSGIEGDPGLPHGLINEPLRMPDTPVYQLRSIAFEESEDLFHQGEPEQTFSWARSDASRFDRQLFRRTEVEAWAENRGFWRAAGDSRTSTLNPKTKTALHSIIGLLARIHGLPLDRHSTAAAQVIKEAEDRGITVSISKRSLEMHLKEVFDQMEQNRKLPDE